MVQAKFTILFIDQKSQINVAKQDLQKHKLKNLERRLVLFLKSYRMTYIYCFFEKLRFSRMALTTISIFSDIVF